MRHRDGGNRRNGAPAMPASVSELARTLRRVRTRQGLRLEDVGARTGLPLDELERLESGEVGRLEDRVATVKALRVYANALGLSGDLYALSLVEHWPTARSSTPPAVAVGERRGPAVVADAPTATVPHRVAGTSSAATTSPTTTSLPVAVAVADPPAWPGTSSTAVAVLDTGLTPAVSGLPHRPRRHRRVGTPLWLRALVVVVALAVVVGVAGLVIQAVQPSWLRAIGLTHANHPGTSGSTATSGTAAPTTTAVAVNGLRLTSTTPTAATFAVRASTFTVETSAVGNPSWVQITEAGQTTPLFAGILEAGQSKSFSTQHSLVVEVGSSAAHLFVSSGAKNLGLYFPKAAPYTVTFNAAS